MEIVNSAGMLVLLVFAGVGALLVSKRLDRLETRMDRLPTREEIDARFDGVDARFDGVDARFDELGGRVSRLEAEYAGLRTDLTQIALAVGARTRPQTG